MVTELARADESWIIQANAFLTKHCADCHSGDDAKADFRTDRLSPDSADPKVLDTWVKLYDKVARHEMPPADATQPTQSERDALCAALDQPLTKADLALQAKFGRTVLRRLNRIEYEYTMRDLLSLPHLELKDSIPADSESNGFDTVGAVLTFSYVQQDAYLKSTEAALSRAIALYAQPKLQHYRAVFADPPPPRPDRVYPPKPKHGLLLFTNANLDPPLFIRNNVGSPFIATGNGMYKIRLRARGGTYDNREQGGGMDGTVTDSEMPHVILLYAEQPPFSRWLATFDLPCDRLGELELNTWLNAGEKVRQIYASLHESGQPYRPYEKPFRGTFIGIESFDAEGPFAAQWPPESHRRVLGDLALKPLPKSAIAVKPQAPGVPIATLTPDPQDPSADAERLIADFVPRAFRRQTSQTEIDRYKVISQKLLSENLSFHDSLFAAYQAALCSPDFLYFQEQPGPLDGEALANRLSYFLWRSMPDETLSKAGRDGKLRDPTELHTQVERLLNDLRAERFVNDFTDQWLKLREIAFTQADPDLYPEYHEDFLLQDSLLRETRAYFAEMLRHDLGVEHVVDSDFVMINRRLAELYDLPPIEGTEIRKVKLPSGSVRGGLLTQASVLKVTANGTTTTPVVRGVFIMDRILGSPPPPPPADVPAIEPDTSGAVTIRDQLAKHRQVATCAMCHKHIDPPGFALESFDVLGGFRTQYRALGGKKVQASVRNVKVKYSLGPPVECGGETAMGQTFGDIHQFKQLLLQDKPRLARNLVERLVTYSTGAPVQFADRADVEAIVERLSTKNFGLRAMIHEVVQSRMFQNK